MSTAATAIAYKVPKRRHPVLQFILQQPLGAGGLVFITLMAVCAAAAPLVSPYDPLAVDYGAMLAAPSWNHWLGTDSFGRDVLSRIIYGARTALAIGFIASFLGSTIGAVIGVISAYFGGKTDLIIQGIMDVLLSFPIIVLAITVVAILGNYVVLGIDVNLIIAIALPMVPRVERVVRASRGRSGRKTSNADSKSSRHAQSGAARVGSPGQVAQQLLAVPGGTAPDG